MNSCKTEYFVFMNDIFSIIQFLLKICNTIVWKKNIYQRKKMFNKKASKNQIKTDY